MNACMSSRPRPRSREALSEFQRPRSLTTIATRPDVSSASSPISPTWTSSGCSIAFEQASLTAKTISNTRPRRPRDRGASRRDSGAPRRETTTRARGEGSCGPGRAGRFARRAALDRPGDRRTRIRRRPRRPLRAGSRPTSRRGRRARRCRRRSTLRGARRARPCRGRARSRRRSPARPPSTRRPALAPIGRERPSSSRRTEPSGARSNGGGWPALASRSCPRDGASSAKTTVAKMSSPLSQASRFSRVKCLGGPEAFGRVRAQHIAEPAHGRRRAHAVPDDVSDRDPDRAVGELETSYQSPPTATPTVPGTYRAAASTPSIAGRRSGRRLRCRISAIRCSRSCTCARSIATAARAATSRRSSSPRGRSPAARRADLQHADDPPAMRAARAERGSRLGSRFRARSFEGPRRLAPIWWLAIRPASRRRAGSVARAGRRRPSAGRRACPAPPPSGPPAASAAIASGAGRGSRSRKSLDFDPLENVASITVRQPLQARGGRPGASGRAPPGGGAGVGPSGRGTSNQFVAKRATLSARRLRRRGANEGHVRGRSSRGTQRHHHRRRRPDSGAVVECRGPGMLAERCSRRPEARQSLHRLRSSSPRSNLVAGSASTVVLAVPCRSSRPCTSRRSGRVARRAGTVRSNRGSSCSVSVRVREEVFALLGLAAASGGRRSPHAALRSLRSSQTSDATRAPRTRGRRAPAGQRAGQHHAEALDTAPSVPRPGVRRR